LKSDEIPIHILRIFCFLIDNNNTLIFFSALLSAAIFGNVSSIMLRVYQGSDEFHEKVQSISVLLVEETEGPGEKPRPVENH
jgi:hypothetical protein